MYYAEEQYFIDQYKKNKTAFEDVKDDLLLTLEKENATELNLVIDYDSEAGRLLQHYDRTSYSVDYSHPIDANSESYNAVNEPFGDFLLSKIYVTHNYIYLKKIIITNTYILLKTNQNQHTMVAVKMIKFILLEIIGI